MRADGGVHVQIDVFLTSVLVEREWSASRPGRLIPGERSASTHRIRGWVGPSTGLDDVEKILNHTGIRTRTNSGSACWNSDKSPLSLRLSEAIKICETIILSLVSCRCEISSVSLMEEHRLRFFENRVLRTILGTQRGASNKGTEDIS
jgi:hypothetical protein